MGSADSMLLSRSDPKFRTKLTDYIWAQNEFGAIPEITSTTIKLVHVQRALPVGERLARLLRQIGREVPALGEKAKVDFGESDKVTMRLLAASSSQTGSELKWLLQYQQEEKLIKLQESSPTWRVYLTPEGLAKLEEPSNEGRNRSEAFVAMWFHPTMDGLYTDGIAPGISDAGYRPVRIDRVEHSNKIDDEIIAGIRGCAFLVADFTCEPDKPRGGVYFEAGFAFGLSKPVIWSCREDQMTTIHFDTRQYNHIGWSTPGELRAKLKNRILAVCGPGPLASIP